MNFSFQKRSSHCNLLCFAHYNMSIPSFPFCYVTSCPAVYFLLHYLLHYFLFYFVFLFLCSFITSCPAVDSFSHFSLYNFSYRWFSLTFYSSHNFSVINSLLLHSSSFLFHPHLPFALCSLYNYPFFINYLLIFLWCKISCSLSNFLLLFNRHKSRSLINSHFFIRHFVAFICYQILRGNTTTNLLSFSHVSVSSHYGFRR
jgi:hypothetical protein